jgi:hypothetical protein
MSGTAIPQPKDDTIQVRRYCKRLLSFTDIFARGLERSATPMPGVKLQSLIRELIPIESSASPSQDKGKGRAVESMDEGKSERECLVSLTMSKFEGVFHGGSLAFVYDWIDDVHGDSDPEGPRESVDDWLTDQSYMDASEDPIELSCINSSGGTVKRNNHKSSLLVC